MEVSMRAESCRILLATAGRAFMQGAVQRLHDSSVALMGARLEAPLDGADHPVWSNQPRQNKRIAGGGTGGLRAGLQRRGARWR